LLQAAPILDPEQKTGTRCGSCHTYGNRQSVAFGNFFLMISTGVWKRASQKHSAFSTATHSAGND